LQELGSGWLDRLHPADRDRCLHAQAEALAKQCPFMIEYRLLRRDGTWRWLRDEARPNTIEGRFAGHVGACADVTDLHAALARHTDAEAHAEREMLRAELRHRVKNNIQSTISFLALQARRTRDAAAAEALRSAAMRVLLASQVQDRRFHGAEDSAIPLLEELETAARAAMESASRPGIAFALDPGSAALVVPPGQAASLALLLNELMMNALRHAFPDGRHGEIRLALRRLGDRRAELRLRDDGIGIPAPIRERLPRHTLGLHLASRLARQARGRLHLEGPPGTVAVVLFAVE
jgi:two-component sensor histidine kinase